MPRTTAQAMERKRKRRTVMKTNECRRREKRSEEWREDPEIDEWWREGYAEESAEDWRNLVEWWKDKCKKMKDEDERKKKEKEKRRRERGKREQEERKREQDERRERYCIELWRESAEEFDEDWIKIVEWKDNDCPWEPNNTVGAAQNGELECLRYAHENDCPWDPETTIWAAQNEHTKWISISLWKCRKFIRSVQDRLRERERKRREGTGEEGAG